LQRRASLFANRVSLAAIARTPNLSVRLAGSLPLFVKESRCGVIICTIAIRAEKSLVNRAEKSRLSLNRVKKSYANHANRLATTFAQNPDFSQD
jgi:hypothetical protein